ncbi:hypothetical protein [Actinoalloteichus caeruleus]|uniref:hypothetical protein n=1 Tax=Actinoalloteichus cyanogriseus TaxID=2893586 RepID=UPI0004AA1DAF|nr:hypothetical protein [Actinoalloteichus caeruleus]
MTRLRAYRTRSYPLSMKGFDYEPIERDLNDLGRQGREAVSTLPPASGPVRPSRSSSSSHAPRPDPVQPTPAAGTATTPA